MQVVVSLRGVHNSMEPIVVNSGRVILWLSLASLKLLCTAVLPPQQQRAKQYSLENKAHLPFNFIENSQPPKTTKE